MSAAILSTDRYEYRVVGIEAQNEQELAVAATTIAAAFIATAGFDGP